MKSGLLAVLLFVIGLLLGTVFGWLAADAVHPVVEAAEPDPARYQFIEDAEGRLSVFDQVTGRHTSFVQTDGLWFVMTHDPVTGSVSYRRTELIEDPAFLEAARELRNDFPGRMGSEVILGPVLETP